MSFLRRRTTVELRFFADVRKAKPARKPFPLANMMGIAPKHYKRRTQPVVASDVHDNDYPHNYSGRKITRQPHTSQASLDILPQGKSHIRTIQRIVDAWFPSDLTQ
jgi:hypothetical protein